MDSPENPDPSLGRLRWRLGFFAFLGAGVLTLTAFRPLFPALEVDVQQEAQTLLQTYKPGQLEGDLSGILAEPARYYVPSIDHPLIGAPAPRFRLRDWQGRQVELDELIARGPVALVFYYGFWCDHCVVQLYDLSEEVERFRALGATVVAISADPPAETADKFAQFGKFAFDVLSDPEHRVTQQYDCYDPPEAGREEKLFHGTFVIDREGIVRWGDIADQPFRSSRTLLYELARLQGVLPAHIPDVSTASSR